MALLAALISLDFDFPCRRTSENRLLGESKTRVSWFDRALGEAARTQLDVHLWNPFERRFLDMQAPVPW